MPRGNFTESDVSGPNPRTVLRAVLGTSLERKTARTAISSPGSGAFWEDEISPDSQSMQPYERIEFRNELPAIVEWSRAMLGEAGGALFCTTATGQVWVLETVTSAIGAALKLVERAKASDSVVLRVAVDLGDVEVGSRGAVFERVLDQVNAWPGPGIACSLAAASAVSRGSNFEFRPGPLPDTVSPSLVDLWSVQLTDSGFSEISAD